jgi:DMSO/TMAO reductase YedYZ molybdopterin-dependent catalytic subunit
VTNLTLLGGLAITFATGVLAVATGSAAGRWVTVAHGVGALAVLLLVPWKTRIAGRGLRRRRPTRWLSLALAALALSTLAAGLLHSTGLVRSVDGVRTMWLHVAAALALAPLLLWHALARPARPRRGDLSRRTLLRAATLGAVAGGAWAVLAGITERAALPGARRRFTGSYDAGSGDPSAMPNTIWLDDTTPRVDATTWRLTVVDATGVRELTLPELTSPELIGAPRTWRATLDCTSGWYADQDWTGVPVRALVGDPGPARSLLVRSVTGYWVRLPVSDLDRLLLATAVGGRPLSAGHGFPLRLVAPDRRGYWWVKWVDRIELAAAPWWWQPPFPVT